MQTFVCLSLSRKISRWTRIKIELTLTQPTSPWQAAIHNKIGLSAALPHHPVVNWATEDKSVDGNCGNHPGHRVVAQFVNLHPVLSRGLNRFSDDFWEEPRGPSHAMTRDERPGIIFLLLGPLALMSAMTN